MNNMDSLLSFDTELLLFINGHHCPFMDQVMWYISTKWLWIPLYIALAGLLCWRFGWKKTLLYLAAFGIAVGLSDYISSGVLKPLFARFRPTREPALQGLVHMVNDYCGGKYGFPSSHASNTMSVALLFCLIWSQPSGREVKKSHLAWWLLMIWSLVVCYSRMYLGVHYPLDITCGLILGALVAAAVFLLLRSVETAYRRRDADRDRTSGEDDDGKVRSACP